MDEAYRIEDQAAFTIIHHLRREEGLFLGLSSGINIAGAVRYARQHGPDQTIVTILCDSGHKYIPRLYNPEWFNAHDLRDDLPLESLL